jgi:hypothetical protein
MSFATRHQDLIQELLAQVEVVRAFERGENVKYRANNNTEAKWSDMTAMSGFDFDRYAYWVTPKEREAFMVTDPCDEENVQFFLDRKEAEDFAEEMAGEHGDSSGMVRKFIEVLE